MADGVSSRMAADGEPARRRAPDALDGADVWRALRLRGRSALHIGIHYVFLPLGSGFLLGRAIAFNTLHPFGIAFVVALASVGQRGRSLVAAFGVFLAALLSPAGSAVDDPAAVLVFVWLLAALVGRLFHFAPWVSASGAMLGAASLRFVSAAFSAENLVIAAVAGAIDLAAVWVLLPVVQQLFRSSRAKQAERGGGYTAAFLVFVSLLLMGTAGLQLWGVSLYALLTRTVVLLAATIGGIGGGAVAGTLLALLTVIGGSGALWDAVVFAGAGLGAGLGSLLWSSAANGRPKGDASARWTARLGPLGGLLIAHLLLSSFAGGGDEVRFGLLYSVLAGAVVSFVPRGWIRRWRFQVGFSGSQGDGAGPASATAPWREGLLRVAAVFEQSAASLLSDDAGAEHAYSTESTAPDAYGVAETSSHFRAPSAGDPHELDLFVEDVRQMVCRGCSHELICWETYGDETYRDVLSLAAKADNADEDLETFAVEPRDLPDGLQRRCIKPKHLAPGVEKLLALVYDRSRRERQMQQWQAPLQRQLNGLADIIAGVADEIDRLHEAEPTPAHTGAVDHPRFQLQTDCVCMPGDASVVSGDSFQQVHLPDERVAFIVCDGMGSGERAAAESQAVVAMLGRFLKAGFDLRFCVQTINAVMLLRAADESFVTVDVSVVNLRDGTLHIAKTGAAPTYVHRGYEAEMVRADSLPIGVLPAVEVYETRLELNLGDVVVMMSDGGLELGPLRGDKGEWMRRHMERLERPRPREVVDSLFARTHRRTGHALPDDVTIVATQLLPAVIR